MRIDATSFWCHLSTATPKLQLMTRRTALPRAKQEEEGEYRLNVRFPVEMGYMLKQLAEQNRRSINNEILCLVEGGIKAASNPTA
ncbi:Arc family DNA-binding protein [Sphingobium sp. AR-3-1]|uniref:Arc family DNA-binding protein n=1 Tax=Sphingobium psychrophilum TaxID=2728834 RepID=A0A7X9WWQ1_9SPHN|nr:Arc family DNA-binding protein [Sphingobium psychrophilum]